MVRRRYSTQRKRYSTHRKRYSTQRKKPCRARPSGGKGTERASVRSSGEVSRLDHIPPGGHGRALECSQEPRGGEVKQVSTMT